MKAQETFYIGVDFSITRRSEVAVIDRQRILIYVDALNEREILSLAKSFPQAIIGVDAPLTIPREGPWRECDIMLLKDRIPCLPPGGGNFRKLTERAVRFSEALAREGVRHIEVYPYATRVRLGIGIGAKKLKASGRDRIKNDLLKYVRDPRGLLDNISHHGIDATISALTVYLADSGLCEILGGRDGVIYVPLKKTVHRSLYKNINP